MINPTDRIMMIDTETTNDIDCPIVYDVGFQVFDLNGNTFASDSLINADVFLDKELMKSAYYAEKIPQYIQGIKDRAFKVRTFRQVRWLIKDAMERWNCSIVCAYNANFDVTALNTTERWLTKSQYRYFLPYGTQVFCIWHMACQVICTQTKYIKFCLANNFVSPSGNIKTSAEAVYAFLTKDSHYEECHTGLQDVLIESKIMAECFRKHKKMEKNINRLCWRIPQKKAKQIQKELG